MNVVREVDVVSLLKEWDWLDGSITPTKDNIHMIFTLCKYEMMMMMLLLLFAVICTYHVAGGVSL